MKQKKLIFIALFFICALIPLVTYPIWGHQPAESANTVKIWPSVRTEENKLNINYFGEAGDYFSSNFALRQNLVTVDSAIKSKVFHTSSQDNVVVGKKGWLYYGSTLDDFRGYQTLSDVDLSHVIYNLTLMQETLNNDGKKFVFTIAPNKSSLYPQFMPSRYKGSTDGRNAERLLKKLEKSTVNYVNLHQLFRSQDKILYHKTDSHWTNEGAALANQVILSAVDKKATDYSKVSYQIKNDFHGDLYKMLYPISTGKEAEVYYDKKNDYTYDYDIESTYDEEIETTNPKQTGSIVMFRDSFGNSLLPFTANEYEKGYFSRYVPFNVYSAYEKDADTVVAEIVERNLNLLAERAPLLATKDVSSEVVLPEKRTKSAFVSMTVSKEALSDTTNYLKIYGRLDNNQITDNTKLYVSLFDEDQGFGYVFQAYYGKEEDSLEQKSSDGYTAYANLSDIAPGNYKLSIVTENDGNLTRSKDLKEYTVK